MNSCSLTRCSAAEHQQVSRQTESEPATRAATQENITLSTSDVILQKEAADESSTRTSRDVFL